MRKGGSPGNMLIVRLLCFYYIYMFNVRSLPLIFSMCVWGVLGKSCCWLSLLWSHMVSFDQGSENGLCRFASPTCPRVAPHLFIHIFSLFFCSDTQRRGVEVNYLGHDSPDSSASRSLEQLAMWKLCLRPFVCHLKNRLIELPPQASSAVKMLRKANLVPWHVLRAKSALSTS